VVEDLADGSHREDLGYWKNTKKGGNDTLPKFTRAQLVGCWSNPKLPKCSYAGKDWIKDYAFIWRSSPGPLERLKVWLSLQGQNNSDQERICWLGASHSRDLNGALNRSLTSLAKESSLSLLTYHVFATFPSVIGTRYINENLIHLNCTKIIMAVGQWPASFKTG
jgi:hypothetical protein